MVFSLSPAGEGKVCEALEKRGAPQSRLIFRDHLHEDQEWSSPKNRKLDKNARRPVWRSKELAPGHTET